MASIVMAADYESDDYILDTIGWRSIPAEGESEEYAVRGSTTFSQGLTDTDTYTLHAGSADAATLPTPLAPTLSLSESQAALHLEVHLGENDPHVEVQVRLINRNGSHIYVTPTDVITDETQWYSSVSWGGVAGKELSSVPADSYTAQVRAKAGDFGLSEWSAESSVVTLTAGGPVTTTTTPDVGVPASLQGLLQALQRLIQNSGLTQPAGLAALLLVPLTALAFLPHFIAASGFLLHLLLELLRQLLAFFYKRRSYGVVYDGSGRKPLVGAVVEIMRPETRQHLDSQITDTKGRYYFLDNKRVMYLVRVTHPQFEPFEQLVRGHVNIGIYLGRSIEFNQALLLRQSRRTALLEVVGALRVWLLVIGTVAWGWLFMGGNQEGIGYILGVYYVLAWLLELSIQRQPRPYGVVVNAKTAEPLGLTVVRITNHKGQRISSVVCDEKGRFKTWLHPGTYRLDFSKSGFVPTKIEAMHINNSQRSMEITARLQPSAVVS